MSKIFPINQTNEIEVFYATTQVFTFPVPTGTPAGTEFKLSIREDRNPSLNSMCDATGTIADGVVTFSCDLLNATFLAVSKSSAKAWLEVYASGEVFIQRQINIACRAGSIDGTPPEPITLYYTKAEVDALLAQKMPNVTGATVGQALIWGGTAWIPGEAGSVKSVNGNFPDAQGNVTLTAGSVGALSAQGGTVSGDIALRGLTASNVPDVTSVGATFTPHVLGHYGYTASNGDTVHITPPDNGKTIFDLDVTIPAGTVSFAFDQFINWKGGSVSFTPGTTQELRFEYVGGTFQAGYKDPDLSQYLQKTDTQFGNISWTRVVSNSKISNVFSVNNTGVMLIGAQDFPNERYGYRIEVVNIYAGRVNLKAYNGVDLIDGYQPVKHNGNKPNTKGGFCIPDATTGNITSPGDVIATVSGGTVAMSELATVIVDGGSASTATIDNVQGGRKYKYGTLASLTLTAVENSDREAVIIFTSGATATVLNVPSSMLWSGGEIPTIEANATYAISICNNLAVCGKFKAVTA